MLILLFVCLFVCFFSPERGDYTKKTLGVHCMCFLWNVLYGVQMQRLFDHRRLHPDSLPQTVNKWCRQSQSSSETASVIMEIEGGLVGLRNFLSQPALEDTCQGALWKGVLQLAAERSEWTKADDHAFITPSFLRDFLLPASCLRLSILGGFMCNSVCLNFLFSSPSYTASPSTERTRRGLGISSFSPTGGPGFGSAGDSTMLG